MVEHKPYIYLETFHFDRKLFENCESLVGIDRGGSLTKIVYVSKESYSKQDEKNLELTCVNFLNSTNFEDALLFVKEKSCLKEGDCVHITGAGGFLLKNIIESTLKVKTLFLEEFFCLTSGTHFLLTHDNKDSIFYKDSPIKRDSNQLNGSFCLISRQLANSLPSNTTEEKFPCIVGILGSAAIFLQLNEDGSAKVVGSQFFSGKTFLGLGNILLNTKGYSEIMKLASAGDSNATDLCVSDLLPTNSPYCDFKSNNSVFTFGKVGEEESNWKKEDVAMSFVKLTSRSMAAVIIESCLSQKVKNVVIGGNLTRDEILRDALRSDLPQTIKMEFLKTGHTGAIGAMVGSPESQQNFFISLMKMM